MTVADLLAGRFMALEMDARGGAGPEASKAHQIDHTYLPIGEAERAVPGRGLTLGPGYGPTRLLLAAGFSEQTRYAAQ